MIYPFELHITVDPASPKFNDFERIAKGIGAKVRTLDLHNGELHHMTSQVLHLPDYLMPSVVDSYDKHLQEAGLRIIRTKVESPPWYVENVDRSYHYVELHLNVHVSQLHRLGPTLAQRWHRSTNQDKPFTSLTRRSVSIGMMPAIDCEARWLVDSGIALPQNLEYEVAIIDTNPALDNAWLGI